MRRAFVAAAAFFLGASALATPASAVVIASSTFDIGSEGWTTGDFVTGGADPVGYDAAGWITASDAHNYNVFYAPGAFLGNQSAAYGGTLSFDVSDNEFDLNAETSLISLHTSAGFALYGGLITIPDLTNFTAFSVALTASNFYIGDPNSLTGVQATPAQLLAVLADLAKLGINADYKTGGDFVRLDNVVLASAGAAVPEPASWAMFLIGFGILGAAARRRRESGLIA